MIATFGTVAYTNLVTTTANDTISNQWQIILAPICRDSPPEAWHPFLYKLNNGNTYCMSGIRPYNHYKKESIILLYLMLSCQLCETNLHWLSWAKHSILENTSGIFQHVDTRIRKIYWLCRRIVWRVRTNKKPTTQDQAN